MTVPADPRFVGRAVSVRVNLLVTYPTSAGGGFNNVDQIVERTVQLTAAPPGAQNAYRTIFWYGSVTGFVLLLLSGWLFRVLAVRVAECALPARLLPFEANARS
ncbi:hypothetical protein [Fimbriiglobus ruber]|uniref:Uncharacterized protein n=1 Tax=Fimbriiglobus ruber TaxID=1908690 RepID=A0A225DBY7_9BACT|nr:hypothetical protein [Fimbriiglobus ruber]OWK39051.1 hypothetical protein FRUB_06133 [Fimbriiglobus ruber]